MLYFFLLLLLECVISVFLAFVLFGAARRSLSGKMRYAFLYLLPVFTAVIMIVFTLLFTIPAILDAERFLLGGLSPQQVTVDRLSRWNTVMVDGRRLSYAPWGVEPVEGGVYKVTIAPRSRIILRMEPVGSAMK